MSESKYCRCGHPEGSHADDEGCSAIVTVTHENDDGEVVEDWDEVCDCDEFVPDEVSPMTETTEGPRTPSEGEP